MTVEANGPFVTNVGGNALLDFTCHIRVVPLGYSNERVLSKLQEFDLVKPVRVAEQDIYLRADPSLETAEFPKANHLMDKFTGAPSHYRMDTVSLSNSGTGAVENTMKITYNREAPTKYGYAFKRSFHSQMFGALSLTESREVYTRHYPQVTDIETVPFYANSGYSGDDNVCDCDFFTGDGSRLRNSLSPEGGHVNLDEVAPATPEPIQGVNGYRFPSGAFTAEVGDVCDICDIPLIVDEI